MWCRVAGVGLGGSDAAEGRVVFGACLVGFPAGCAPSFFVPISPTGLGVCGIVVAMSRHAGGSPSYVDEAEIRRWAKEGRTIKFVQGQYREKYGQEVPYSTVAGWLRKFRDSKRPRSLWRVPWRKPENVYEPRQLRRLRWLYTMLNGEELSPSKTHEVATLIRLLEPTINAPFEEVVRKRATSLVLEYDADTGKWEYVRRRPGIDREWIKEPWLDDAGNFRLVGELKRRDVRDDLITEFVKTGKIPSLHGDRDQ